MALLQRKESLREIVTARDIDDVAATLLDRWTSWAQRCRLEPYIKLGPAPSARTANRSS